jgi:hypothetical protein
VPIGGVGAPLHVGMPHASGGQPGTETEHSDSGEGSQVHVLALIAELNNGVGCVPRRSVLLPEGQHQPGRESHQHGGLELVAL